MGAAIDRLREILLAVPPALWLVLPLLVALISLGQAATAAVLGVTVRQVRVGLGPGWTLSRRGGWPLRLGLLPLGGQVLLATRAAPVDPAEPADPVGTCLEDLSRARQALLHLGGPLLLLPLAAGAAALGAPSLAVVCALLAAANLAPVPGTAGGQALLLLWAGLVRRPVPIALQVLWSLAGMAAMAAMVGGLLWLLVGPRTAAAQDCLTRQQPDEPARAVVARAQVSEAEVLARLVHAEAISTGFPEDPAVYRAIAWGTVSRVRLAARSPTAARAYGQGVSGVVFHPGQFNPAISTRSAFGVHFLCPTPGARWDWARAAAEEALAGVGNPFLHTPWEKAQGLSLVVNFYYPASVQARGPLAPWEGSAQLTFLDGSAATGSAPVPPEQVRFYRLSQPPADLR